MALPLVAALGIAAIRQGIPHAAKYLAQRGAQAVTSGASKAAIKAGLKKAPKPDFVTNTAGVTTKAGQKFEVATQGSRAVVPKGGAARGASEAPKPDFVTNSAGQTMRHGQKFELATQGSRSVKPYQAKPSGKGEVIDATPKDKGSIRANLAKVAPIATASAMVPDSTPKKVTLDAKTASDARTASAANDPRRVDKQVATAPASTASKIVKGKAAAGGSRSVAKPAPVAKPAVSTDKPPAEKATSGASVTDLNGNKTTAVTASSAASEPEITMKDIMAKFSVADAKQVGLDTSNAELKKNPQTFLGSFQRFTEGNIDQEGSAAYSKYGAGRGYDELLKREQAKRKKPASK